MPNLKTPIYEILEDSLIYHKVLCVCPSCSKQPYALFNDLELGKVPIESTLYIEIVGKANEKDSDDDPFLNLDEAEVNDLVTRGSRTTADKAMQQLVSNQKILIETC